MAFETTPEALLKFLDENKLTLFIVRDGRVVLRSKEEGLETLALVARDRGEFLKDSIVVDKVVGAAAAALMSTPRPKQVIAATMSLGGRDRLMKLQISPYARELVETLMDDKREALCPMEALAMTGKGAGGIIEAVLGART
ncbi:MAG: DUF1893 domain-containing protein [Planctomycetota bacterium]